MSPDPSWNQPTALRYAVPLAIIIIILLVFIPALDAGIVDWDDSDLLFGTDNYQTLSLDSLRWMFTTSYAGHFQPLTWLSFTLDWAIWKRELFGYHLTNVLLHIGTSLTFYFLTRRLLTTAFGIAKRTCMPVVLSAAVATLIFAIHPLRVESVAWLAERRQMLGSFLYLLSILAYVRYAEPTRARDDDSNDADAHHRATITSPNMRRWYVASVLSCGLSLLSMAAAMTLPFVLWILDVYPLRRWRSLGVGDDSPDARDRLRRPGVSRRLLEKLPFLLLAVAAGVRAVIAQADVGALTTLGRHDIVARIAQACYGLVFYLRKTLWPMNLGPIYELPPRDVLLGSMFWISVGVILLLVFAAIWSLRRAPGIAVSLVGYAVVVAPVLGFAQSGPQLVADRYSYLSCMGLAVLAGAGVLLWLRRYPLSQGTNRAKLLGGLSLVLCALSSLTFAQSDTWLSAKTLWAHAVRVSPGSAIAHTNYGDALARTDDLPGAVHHYRRALEINPDDAVAWHHLGDTYRRVGRDADAIAHYIRALSVDPNRYQACFSLGRLLVRHGQDADGVKVLRDGARRHPERFELIEFLADVLATSSDPTARNAPEAIRWATQVVNAQPTPRPQSLMALAGAYASAGLFQEAIDTGELAISAIDATAPAAIKTMFQRRIAEFRAGKTPPDRG